MADEKPNFTPGTWIAKPAEGGGGIDYRPPIIYAEDGDFIASAVRDEDAVLIAAAPDMYKACKAAQEELRLLRMKDTNVVYDPTVRPLLSAALAKAEGRT